MSPRFRWLDGVARILEADTGDLRALAKIGGADPRTLYIGTNLDGVDVRGQDLRGMVLPGLDLDRARSDQDTRIDDPEPWFDLAQPLIFLADDRLDPRHSLARDVGGLAFDAGVGTPFVEAAMHHDGPLLILATPVSRERAADMAARLRKKGRAFVSILVETARRSLNPKSNHAAASDLQPVVVVQRQSGIFGSSGSALGEVRDLIRLLVSDWDGRGGYLRGGAVRFTRALGIGPDPTLDAAAQIFDRLWQLRASVRDTTLVLRAGEDLYTAPESRLTLSRLLDVWQTVEWPRLTKVRGFDVAVFAPLSIVAPNGEDAYQAIMTALVEQGWAVEWRNAGRDTSDFLIKGSGPTFSGRMSREAGRPAVKHGVLWPPPERFRITEVDRLVLAPEADIGTVAERMLIDREFWVTSRDLLGFPASSPSLWLLVGSQMRRMGRSIEGRGRQLYLRLLLATALEARTVFEPASGLVGSLVRDPEAFEYLKVMSFGYVLGPDRARCQLRITERGGLPAPKGVANLALVVDQFGVWVCSPENATGPRPGLMDGGMDDWFEDGPLFQQVAMRA